MKEERIKIALQKSGRLTDHTLELLQKCGLVITKGKDKLIAYGENMPFDLLFVRDDDIPSLINDGLCHLGFVGLNVAMEKNIHFKSLSDNKPFSIEATLDFGQCRLSFAYPDEADIQSISDLEGKTVATSYPRIVSDYIDQQNLNINVTEFTGAVELAPSLGKSDAICDLISSGSTLRAHNLIEGEVVLESSAVIISANNQLSESKQQWVDKLLERIDGVLQVRESKYIMMHAPRDAIDKITALLPGSESPTIISLEGTDKMVALHMVCLEDVFWETLEGLKSEGASSILVVPVEKMLA
ncbi:MAG TPA: ATP phosphoribosyltransferase [Gammaproteobacteria bacterium]|jgi:ATP phosphoribosyltransferase|nr:ATP phosphoribosyltransferase [Gammaproteobacteria bacterium]HJP42354.1 ATP phosphoribosyltransferase [Gammaproteobacteria bacterium]|tara:strand:+ start:187 stop:1083 length:897 start_codon:yes stop_codon:yes gene_type:complete